MTGKEKILKNLYQELERVHSEAQRNYKEEKIKIDQEELEKRISQSEHLVDFENIEIDKRWLEELFKEYLLALKKFGKENFMLTKKLEDSFERKKLDLEVLIKKVFCSDLNYLRSLAQKLEVEDNDLLFLGLELGKPVFKLYAEKLKGKIEFDNWGKGYCPVCGSHPAMAYLRKDDGKRILWCQFCGTEWSFMRIKCPFCSNEDQNSLRYFFTDEKSPYRVYLCDKCKRYVKTVDQRKIEEGKDFDLGWENLQTFAMDLVAQKEGFLDPYSQPTGRKRRVII